MEREILEYRSTHCVDHGADTHWYLEFYLKASIKTKRWSFGIWQRATSWSCATCASSICCCASQKEVDKTATKVQVQTNIVLQRAILTLAWLRSCGVNGRETIACGRITNQFLQNRLESCWLGHTKDSAVYYSFSTVNNWRTDTQHSHYEPTITLWSPKTKKLRTDFTSVVLSSRLTRTSRSKQWQNELFTQRSVDKEKVEVAVCFTLVHVHRTQITCSCTPARSPELRARAQPGMHYTFSVYKLCEKKKNFRVGPKNTVGRGTRNKE